jgi:hypothetical protein
MYFRHRLQGNAVNSVVLLCIKSGSSWWHQKVKICRVNFQMNLTVWVSHWVAFEDVTFIYWKMEFSGKKLSCKSLDRNVVLVYHAILYLIPDKSNVYSHHPVWSSFGCGTMLISNSIMSYWVSIIFLSWLPVG